MLIFGGNGDGGFAPPVALPPLAQPPALNDGTSQLICADVNDDGRLDIITSHTDGGPEMVAVRLNRGDGAFDLAFTLPIIVKIATLPSKAARNELAKLMVLSKLRGLQNIVVEEAKKVMELTVDDLMDIPFVEEAFLKAEKEGKKEGLVEMLSRMLECRFGPLPEWAKEKIASAEIETLEKWGLRLLEASSLEEVLTDTIN